MRKALKWLYRIAYVFDIFAIFSWLGSMGITVILGAVPLTASIAILIFHIRSAKELKHQGYVSKTNMLWQTLLGLTLVLCLMAVIALLASFDSTTTKGLISESTLVALAVYIVTMSLALAPWLINQRLKPN